MERQQVKQRFGIIGNSPELNRAIDIAMQVASTDLTVLVYGESGVGKEIFPQIIHHFSSRKHGQYIAVNCGAIPEGTIDSELFGHEKGSFTGAHEKRKGYFEEANNGTIFLDEVAELPLSTQVRLLRVLETGEFMKVGSSQVIKTNVRVVAATNIDIQQAIRDGRFREDLFYRLNTVPIIIPPLRKRKEDVHLLFRKFALDFAEKNRMPVIRLNDDALDILANYYWPGNIRQLKNITEQISVIEQNRDISGETLKHYLPAMASTSLPALYGKGVDQQTFNTEREILYKILFDMKSDVTELKKLVLDILESKPAGKINVERDLMIRKLYADPEIVNDDDKKDATPVTIEPTDQNGIQYTEEYVEESLSLEDKEKELILKALERHHGKRKYAARELGISERTLYRKIKEYDID
ncbi:MAG: sigma-54 dependent transcriptional regulator [Bacteroidota bacterium]